MIHNWYCVQQGRNKGTTIASDFYTTVVQNHVQNKDLQIKKKLDQVQNKSRDGNSKRRQPGKR
jgi:hypothetical protein